MTDTTFRSGTSVALGMRAQADRVTGPTSQDRVVRVLLFVALGLAVALGAGLVVQMIGEEGGTNSYAVLADAFLSGQLHVDACFDIDCAVYDGRQYVVFPPAPAILAMPFVAIFGTGFAGFIALATALSAGALYAFWRIFEALRIERATTVWLLLAIAAGSPLYFVTVRGDGVWFIAQVCAFLFSALAILLVLEKRSLMLASGLIGLAFLSRQMTILILPFLYVLWLRSDQKLIGFSRDHIMAAVKLALPIVAALAVYVLYNYARFGSFLDTGYDYILPPPGSETFLTERSAEIGLFSTDFVLFNVLYTFIQGFHIDFTGSQLLELGALDPLGTSILAASPFVLLAVFMPWTRRTVGGLAVVAAMVLPMLLYHSNGYSQYNVQRYFLDWLPVFAVLLALAIKPAMRPAFAVLVTYAIGLNAVTMALAAMQQGAA